MPGERGVTDTRETVNDKGCGKEIRYVSGKVRMNWKETGPDLILYTPASAAACTSAYILLSHKKQVSSTRKQAAGATLLLLLLVRTGFHSVPYSSLVSFFFF